MGAVQNQADKAGGSRKATTGLADAGRQKPDPRVALVYPMITLRRFQLMFLILVRPHIGVAAPLQKNALQRRHNH